MRSPLPSSTFQPGNPGGPGRPKGSRNKLSEAFIEAVHVDFQQHGVAAIEAARVENPLGYVRMIAGLLPQKIDVAHGAAMMSDTELLAIIQGGTEDAASAVGETVTAGFLTSKKRH